MSEAPKVAAATKKYQSYNPNFKTDEEKKEEVSPLFYADMERMITHCSFSTPQLMSAMIEKMGDQDGDPLPQETMDGCDSDEWSD